MSLIGMTTSPEAFLAREAEMCYAVMAHVTDYDVWHETEAAVNVAMLIENLSANAALTKRIGVNELAANKAEAAHRDEVGQANRIAPRSG
jgi:5'-methylthioadenosine phosphorylase